MRARTAGAHRLRPTSGLAIAGLVAGLLPGCGGPPSSEGRVGSAGDASTAAPDSPGPARSARPELVASLREARAAPRSSADGAGRAELITPEPAVAGRAGTWTLRYTAGPEGIVEGGTIDLQVSPFWGWSTPQVRDEAALGYTTIRSAATLDARTADEQMLRLTAGEGGVPAGATVELVYGAGPAGARADRFAEGASRFWFAVDGDGDGIRAVLADSPALVVRPGPPARLVLLGPSTAGPDDEIVLRASVLDAEGSAGGAWEGDVELEWPEGWKGPGSVRMEVSDRGTVAVRAVVAGDGIGRVRARAGGLEAESNPTQVSGGVRVLWGDLQSHSSWSDGTGEPAELFRYAREVAALDVYALTDHDHWGFLFLDEHPELWEEIREAVRRAHEPERFVALLGYEWTSWIHGHRHVLWFDEPGEHHVIRSSLDEAWDTPAELWEALRGEDAMTLSHHPAGGPIATDWSIPPDPELEPLVEIVSVHGASEAPDAPLGIHRPVRGNFVRDALARGYRLGFVGSSDGHDGHPGLAELSSPSGGLVAILADEATRPAVAEALRARRTWATNGPRILVRATLGGHPIGADVEVGLDGPIPGPDSPIPAGVLLARAIAPGELDRIDVVRETGVVGSVDCDGARDCAFELELEEPAAGDWCYLRILQRDGGAAWTSPFFFVAEGEMREGLARRLDGRLVRAGREH